MRLIAILITLVFIGYLVGNQLSKKPSGDQINTSPEKGEVSSPRVPATPKDIESFETGMNRFILDSATSRDEELKRIEELSDE